MSEDNYSNENKNVALNNHHHSKNTKREIEDVSIFIENGVKKRRCGCGCGEIMDAFDRNGRVRYFLKGHNKRTNFEQMKGVINIDDLDLEEAKAVILHQHVTLVNQREELNYSRLGANNLSKMYLRQLAEQDDMIREFQDFFQEYHPDWALMEHELKELFEK